MLAEKHFKGEDFQEAYVESKDRCVVDEAWCPYAAPNN